MHIAEKHACLMSIDHILNNRRIDDGNFDATVATRRSASADRIARRQFQVGGQPVSRTQAIRNDVTAAAL